MKTEKVSENTYRVRKTYKGKRYDVYFDHEPDDKEIMEVVLDKLNSGEFGAIKGTFESCCDKYIELKRNVISPSTIAGYKKLKSYISDELKSKKILSVTQVDIQNEINNFAVGHSPKYVRNLHGFISAVLKTFRPTMNIHTTLPQKRKFTHTLPTTEGVKMILDASAGTPYHIPFQLAVLGMRRSEICGVTIDDINGNILTIDKASVYDEDYKLVTKDTKTTESTREIFLPDSLVAEIRESGTIFDYQPQALTRALHRYQDKLGLERFRLHDFRGYFASYAHSQGIPDVYILKMGGWKTDFVMKSVYRDALKEKNQEMQEKIASEIFG